MEKGNNISSNPRKVWDGVGGGKFTRKGINCRKLTKGIKKSGGITSRWGGGKRNVEKSFEAGECDHW